MPYIPHTPDDLASMLQTLEVDTIDALFDEIPASLASAKLDQVPVGLNEQAIARLMHDRSPPSRMGNCFIGAGAYEHHIPAAVWQLVSRGEYYTAYTPYQAEASQGSLQLIYEYQSMMCALMAMEVSNASLYDGATALAEAALMAVRLKRQKAKRVLIPENLHPLYRKTLNNIVTKQGVIVETFPFDLQTGAINRKSLQAMSKDGLAAVVISQPNFFGTLEAVDTLTDDIHALDALVIAVVNPVAMGLLKPPGQWGKTGADIVCGEGQPLGVPLSYGGPYFGFMCCKEIFVRQIPGRLVGKTVDAQGREGYTLTLQAREQHIRRAKATSNICTNQGLMVTAATIHMGIMGPQGLSHQALASHQNAFQLRDALQTIAGVEVVFSAPIFHEFVLRLSKPVSQVLTALEALDLQGGYALNLHYPELGECLLVCATETKTRTDLERYFQLLEKVMSQS